MKEFGDRNAGVSVRRVEHITEALWGTRVTRARVNQRIYAQIRTTELNASATFMLTDDSCDYFRVLTSSAVERPKVSDSSRIARCGRFHASATIYRGRALPSS
jgi:hypothetical protein